MSISIDTHNIAGVKAPLYDESELQCCTQNAYIEVNTKTRSVTVNHNSEISGSTLEKFFNGISLRIKVPNDVDLVEFMEANSKISGSTPEKFFNGISLRIKVPNDVEGDALVEFMEANSEYFEAICDRVYEEFDDLNYVCRYDNEVHDAICSLEQKAAELKRVNICKASEYIAQHPLSVNWPAGKEWFEAAEDLREEFDGVIEGSLLFELLDQAYKSYKNREPITREQYTALVDIGFLLLECSKTKWGR